jgi:hypothetical protein
MDRLEPLISKLKQVMAQAEVAEAQRRREAEAQRESIKVLVSQLTAMHQDYFWQDSLTALAAQTSEPTKRH